MCMHFHKPCRAPAGRSGYAAVMPDDIASPLEALRPAIKARWDFLLRKAPASPVPAMSIVKPGMLVFMLDDTLARLTERLREPLPADRPRRDLAPYGGMRTGCQCGLHLLLTYYLAGARALHESLPGTFGPARVKVQHAFNQLAHDEMAALCGACRHRGGALCCLRPEPDTINPPDAAALPATPSAPGRSPAGRPG